MVVRCPACEAAYRLDAARLPASGVKVRCPRCAQVFVLHAEARPAADALPGLERDLREPPRQRVTPAAGRRAPEGLEPARPARPAWTQERERTLELGAREPAAPAPRLETAPFRPGAAPAVATVPTAPVPAADPHAERARRLARVLVSDILVYNRDARDRALGEGNLSVALAPEITKAWDLFKKKVGAEIASGTSYFKDALNEILAGGSKVF